MKYLIFGWNKSGAYAARLLEMMGHEVILFCTEKPTDLPHKVTFKQYGKANRELVTSNVNEGDSVLLLDSADLDLFFHALADTYKNIHVVLGAQKPFQPGKTPFPVKIINPEAEAAKEMLRAMSGAAIADENNPSLWLKAVSAKDYTQWIGLTLRELKTQVEPLAVAGLLSEGSPKKMKQDDATLISEGDKVILAGPAEWFELLKAREAK